MNIYPPAITEPKRIASWWLRWNDLNWPSPDNHDKIKARAEAMAKANITTAMIFGTHFRWDYLPYFTLLHDYLATVAEELRAVGVELWDHHSVNLIHRYDTREEMRHVMLHSGPHLPFSPSREAAASWEYKGRRLNDWRAIDVKTGKPLYYPQYAAEGFCYRNPAFIEAYCDYVKVLVRDTGITGLSADDPVHYMHYNSCACPHCRAELKRRAGIDLPPIDDRSFWGNWDNPAWKHWLDLRFDASADFFKAVADVLPPDCRLTTCGGNSASPSANAKASDARASLAGCNYANLEMTGNTPPYKGDPLTWNYKISSRLVNASHHQAAAREKGLRCFATGFGFTEDTANIVWAVNKLLDSDCWFSTLKDRLGLPTKILNTLPDEWDIIGRAFGFEKEHPELFSGDHVAQLGVYFSYETRVHTFFGSVEKGYYRDFNETLRTLFAAGISPHTIFDFPTDPDRYPLILIPSPAAMTKEEQQALDVYIANGGIALIYGPAAIDECENHYSLPLAPVIHDPTAFFSDAPDGIHHTSAEWMTKTDFTPITGEFEWREIRKGIFYHPCRISNGNITDSLLHLTRRYAKPTAIGVISATGYLMTYFEDANSYTVRMLAEDFDTDIDHTLDEMRFHRSRVNYINYVKPTGVTQAIRFTAPTRPEVFTPFNDSPTQLTLEDDIYTLTLSEPTSFIILRFPKK